MCPSSARCGHNKPSLSSSAWTFSYPLKSVKAKPLAYQHQSPAEVIASVKAHTASSKTGKFTLRTSHGKCRSTATERKRKTQECKLKVGISVTARCRSVRLRLAQRTVLPTEETPLFRYQPQPQTISTKDKRSRKKSLKHATTAKEAEKKWQWE